MGLTNKSLILFINALENIEGIGDKSCIELGDQEFVEPIEKFRYVRDRFSAMFKEYKSIDLHATRGITLCDLSIYQEKKFKADVLTNFGTSEHVEYEEGQYNCWKNIHSWTSLGGYSMHLTPEIGSWINHCRYYTTFDFYNNLRNYGYEIKKLEEYEDENGNLNWCVLQKVKDMEFMTFEDFFKFMKVDYSVTFNNIASLNNPKNLK